jgi:hypothetical protein
MTNLIEEEVKSGRAIHVEVELPPDLQARLDSIRLIGIKV